MNKLYFLLALLVAILVTSKTSAQCSSSENSNIKKTAIVFGQKEYKYVSPLFNTVNDANDISDSLKRLGFDVFTYKDTDLKTMTKALTDWAKDLQYYDLALFYYSGHGAEVDGKNYLFPIDAILTTVSDVYYKTYPVDSVLNFLNNSSTKTNIIILDACRDNPFAKKIKGILKPGLAAITTGRGMCIGFAAAAGKTASDGEGRNGTYTEGLLQNITNPNKSILQIFTAANKHVSVKSGGLQTPFIYSSLQDDFCLTPPKSTITKATSKNSVYQPTSIAQINADGNSIVIIDSLNSNITIKDPRTLQTKVHLAKNVKGLSQLQFVDDNNFVVLDTLNRKISIINIGAKTISRETNLEGVPKSFLLSPDQRFAYVIYSDSLHSKKIDKVDFSTNLVSNVIDVDIDLQALTFSPDLKSIYASSSSRSLAIQDSVVIVNIAARKVEKYISFPGGGDLIQISPDKKYVFLVYISKRTPTSVIRILDPGTLNILGTVTTECSKISFSQDARYTFFLGGKKLSILRNSDKILINEMSFITEVKAVVTAGDESVFIWLPKEDRLMPFSIPSITEVRANRSPDLVLGEFYQKQLSKNATDSRIEKKRLLERAKEIHTSTINNLRSSLGEGFEIKEEHNKLNLYEFTYVAKIGCYSIFDSTIRIVYTFKVELIQNRLLCRISEDGGESKTITIPASLDIGWPEIHTAIRTFFIERISRFE